MIVIYLIYFYYAKTSINYLAISDTIMASDMNYSDYVKIDLAKKKNFHEFNTSFINNSTRLVYQDIVNNRTIKKEAKDYYFKKCLRESDLVVISVGMEEFSSNYHKYDMKDNYAYFDKLFLNIEKLVNVIRQYAQDQILFLGFYNPTNYYDSEVDRLFYDMDIKLNRLMVNNDINYINLYELVKGNNYKEKNSVYLNNLAHQKIASIIEFYIK